MKNTSQRNFVLLEVFWRISFRLQHLGEVFSKFIDTHGFEVKVVKETGLVVRLVVIYWLWCFVEVLKAVP